MRKALLAVALLLVLVGSALGNTGVFAGSGHTLRLVKSADIQMVSEDVTIEPICGASAMMSSVDFRCEFVLKNLSAKALTIQVGFPLDRESHGPPASPSDDADKVLSYHFIARDANNTYHVRHEPSDPQGKYAHIFLWNMEFAAGETKTLHVGYILPMSFAAATTRKRNNDPSKPEDIPEYEKPWHVRIEPSMAIFFSYITETGQSWAGPIERATFRFKNNVFEHCLRKCPEYVGGNPADLTPETAAAIEASSAESVPGMADRGFVFGMKLGTVYRHISPDGWKPGYIPEIPRGEPKPQYEPDGIVWTFEKYRPGPPLTFRYYLVGFPEVAADCDLWVRQVLGKNPTKSDVLELRGIVAAFFGLAPQSASVKHLAEQQAWFHPQSKLRESELSEPQRAVLARLGKIADDQRTVASAPAPALSPLAAQEPGLRDELKGHAYQVTAVLFCPDGKTLASASCDRKIKLWDVAARMKTANLTGHANAVVAIAVNKAAGLLASGDFDGAIKVWDLMSGKNVTTVSGDKECIESLAFSPDGKMVASASGTAVKLWSVATGKNTVTFPHKTNIRSVAYSPDGKIIASGGNDNVIYLWDTSSGRNPATLKSHKDCIFSLAFSPNGRVLASASGDKSIKLWDVTTKADTATLADTSSVLSVAFSPDGKFLASGSQGETIKLWDVATGKNAARLGSKICWVNSLAFNADGKLLASSGTLGKLDNNTVKLWNVPTTAKGSENAGREENRKTAAHPTTKDKIEAHFTAKVNWIEMLGKRKAKVVPIEVVPMWLAEVDILSIEKPVKPFDKKGKVILAIHSPARLFMEPAEEVPGKQYSFTVFGTLRDGNPDYYGAEAKGNKGSESKEP